MADEPAQSAEHYGHFAFDSRAGSDGRPFDAFARTWRRQFGEHCPLPPFTPSCTADFRIASRVTRLYDLAITDITGWSPLRTAGKFAEEEANVELSIVGQGSWTTRDAGGTDTRTLESGIFEVRHMTEPVHFRTQPGTRVRLLSIPSAALRPVLGRKAVQGPVALPEMRLLAAHATLIHDTVAQLGAAGAAAAYHTLIELAKAVTLSRFDECEPRLTPALVLAAQRLIDSRLAERELSPAHVAQQLRVSTRTLQRAFAATGEPVSAYIRGGRLRRARADLVASPHRPNVAEIAARWHFADSSHLIRAFKQEYGQTPAAYARTNRRPAESPHGS